MEKIELKNVKGKFEILPPQDFILKEDVKKRIKSDIKLQAIILFYMDISFSTLRKWLIDDDLKTTSRKMLQLLYNYYLVELPDTFKKLDDFLTTKS